MAKRYSIKTRASEQHANRLPLRVVLCSRCPVLNKTSRPTYCCRLSVQVLTRDLTPIYASHGCCRLSARPRRVLTCAQHRARILTCPCVSTCPCICVRRPLPSWPCSLKRPIALVDGEVETRPSVSLSRRADAVTSSKSTGTRRSWSFPPAVRKRGLWARGFMYQAVHLP